jgi:hypothetical protein
MGGSSGYFLDKIQSPGLGRWHSFLHPQQQFGSAFSPYQGSSFLHPVLFLSQTPVIIVFLPKCQGNPARKHNKMNHFPDESFSLTSPFLFDNFRKNSSTP